MAKKLSSTRPSIREMADGPRPSNKRSLAMKKATMIPSRLRGISFHTVFRCTPSGRIKAARPRIRQIFIILLPITLPSATSALPELAAMTETISSGDEVPKATTVRPITRSDILNRLASDDEPSTMILAP
ncbi:MAG: hypothetical protein R2791_01855 [Saprospiraceae bacterium]